MPHKLIDCQGRNSSNEEIHIVIDASVALKWFLPDETGGLQALDILKKYAEGKVELVAPDLLDYEVFNGLLIAYRRNRLAKKLAEVASKKFLELQIRHEPVKQDNLIALALETGLSIYDAAYLGLAHQIKTQLVTADRPLFTNGRKILPDAIVWIEDWPVI